MESHVAEKTFHHAIILLVMFFAHTDSKPLWLWTKGCNAVQVYGTVYNISDNSPIACFQSCDRETNSIALKENVCACQFNNSGTMNNNVCSVKCAGDDISMCGSQTKQGWSVYTKADESEIENKKIPQNIPGCMSIVPNGGYKHHLLPCNFSLAYSLCELYLRCHFDVYLVPASNWTFACGYRTPGSAYGRYPFGFSKTEKCIRSDLNARGDRQFWIGLFAPGNEEPIKPTISSTNAYEYSSRDSMNYLSFIEPSLTDIHESSASSLDYLSSVYLTSISPTSSNAYGSTILISSFDKVISTTEQTSISSTVKVSPTSTQSLMTSFDIGYTADFSLTTSLPSTHVLSAWSQNNAHEKFPIMFSTKETVHSDKTHSTTSVSNANSSVMSIKILPSSSSSLYQTTTRTSPVSKFNSGTTPWVETDPSRNEGKQDKVSTITSITAGAVALCLLIAVTGLAIYVRKHATKHANLGSSNFSDIGHQSAISMKTFTNVFTDDRSQQIIRSVNDDQNESIPNLARSTRADLRMTNNTSSGFSSIGNRAKENEYVLY